MAISEDTGNQPVAVHPTGASPATTAAFTPQAGTLLVAMVGINGPSGTAITATITDSLSGGWTLLKRQNTSSSMGGTAEVWCRYLSSAPGSMTVTSTWTGGDTGATLVVRSLLGASSVQTGATAGVGGASIAPNTTLTPTQIGSWIYGALLDWSAATAMTANANTTINDATNGDTYAALKAATASAALSSTSYGCTTANAAYNVAFAEILPALSLVAEPNRELLPSDDPFRFDSWMGAAEGVRDVIVNAGTASITFLSPATRPMMLLALTSESGPGATVITNPDQLAIPVPMLTPDDVTGGMAPWGGAPDVASSSNISVNAGVASVSFVAQAPSASLSALPGTGSLTFVAQAPTAAVGALPGTSSVTLVAQAPAVALASLPGAAAVSITAQAPTAGLGALPGTASVTFAARSATAGLGALPGTASITTTAPQEISDVGALPTPAVIVFAAPDAAGVAIDGTWDPSAPLFLPDDPYGGMIPWAGVVDGIVTGDATVNAGVASMTIAAQSPTASLGISAGTATMSVVAQAPSAGLAALPAPGSITLTAQGPTAAVSSLPGTATVSLAGRSATSGTGAAPGTASVSFVARSASAGLAALPGTGSITLAANAPQAAVGALPGASSIAFAARDSSVGIAALPGASSITFTAPAASIPGTVIANAGVASISFTARTPAAGAGALPGTASITFAGRSASSALAALPGTAVVSVAASGASVVLPQVGTPTLISGREPVSGLSGRESITSASGAETGPISGREPLSSTSGTETPTTIRGRES
jgi:hypothetical protein